MSDGRKPSSTESRPAVQAGGSEPVAGHQHFGEDMGRLFEIGFATGLLSALGQETCLTNPAYDYYRQELAQLHFESLYSKLSKRNSVFSSWDRDQLRLWALFILLRGYLGGRTFFQEFLEALTTSERATPELLYLQCRFHGPNSLGTYEKKETQAFAGLLEQLRQHIPSLPASEQLYEAYRRRGQFPQADLLLLLRQGKGWRILCIDLSVFSVRSLGDAAKLTSVEAIQGLLLRELRYMRTRSAFTNLSIDTDTALVSGQELLATGLKRYFYAFSRQDKESYKLIQAASYAYSFYRFLLRYKLLSQQDDITFHIIGYTDRGTNSMTLGRDQVAVLEACAEIYREREEGLLPAGQEIEASRQRLLDIISHYVRRCFQQGEPFIKQLLEQPGRGDGLHWISHEERLSDFVGMETPLTAGQVTPELQALFPNQPCAGRTLRALHEELVRRELEQATPYLFLTGTPGIGKTTAIVNFLKERAMQGEGFLFIYVSPRKQVNLDIINKFRHPSPKGTLRCDTLLALTTNSAYIQANGGQPTVHYYSSLRNDRFSVSGVHFLPAEGHEAQQQRPRQRRLEEIEEGLLIDRGQNISGVLNSLCSAINVALTEQLSNTIVATVAVQSLRRTNSEQATTLGHLKKIFQSLTNQGLLQPMALEQLSQRIKYIFFMIDEVTGDESGAAFVEGIHSLLSQYQLFNRPAIRCKIIVADASIVDPQLIQRHLENSAYEPDKIYFRRASQPPQPLSRSTFRFKRQEAVGINANAYPASSLRLRYRVGLEIEPYEDTTALQAISRQLKSGLQQHLLEDLLAILQQPEAPQVLVYIQDKQRLAELISVLKKRLGQFQLYEDYLTIHANISEEEKRKVQDYQNQVRVVFMTASASRGLSFERAREILVDVPRFAIEQNLMEILQVIYRGRGGDFDNLEKGITFYLSDRFFYSRAEERESSLRESLLALLNILLILKTSLLTRIKGEGQIGHSRFLMIPIGGKAVLSAGESLTSRLGRLLDQLDDLRYQHPDNPAFREVAEYLTSLLSQARIELFPPSAGQRSRSQQRPALQQGKRQSLPRPYLTVLDRLAHEFEQAAIRGFDHLLTIPPLERAYIVGSLLIVPLEKRRLHEEYWISLLRLLQSDRNGEELLRRMEKLVHDPRCNEEIRLLLKEGIVLIKELYRISRHASVIPHVNQETRHADQHYTIPLHTLLVSQVFRNHFQSGEKNLADSAWNFRRLLESYLRTLYPIDSVLPLSHHYESFPFLVFRSYNLSEARRKIFLDHYLFMSHELNIINMLLARSAPEEQL
ncbi:helicase [Thermogemmatispora sp.]|uniref:helicase n=1 Tax=Thermogemmatispora sp. TaxID=1968838 RepID=UPI0035E44192